MATKKKTTTASSSKSTKASKSKATKTMKKSKQTASTKSSTQKKKKTATKKPQTSRSQKTTKKSSSKKTATQKKATKSSKSTTATKKTQKPLRYSDKELEMFRKHIEKIRAQTLEEFHMLKERLEDMNSDEMVPETAAYSVHMAEEGTNAQEKEKLFTQLQRLSDYLKKLDEALERIKNKTYGICRVCGILIAKERLLAVPITTLSASYKIHKKCPPDGVDRIHPPEELEEPK